MIEKVYDYVVITSHLAKKSDYICQITHFYGTRSASVYIHCPFFTVGYSDGDVLYRWTKGRGVNIASDMKLSQFDLIKTPTGNRTMAMNKSKYK